MITTIPATNSQGITITVYRPTRADVEAVTVGELAPDCFGYMAEVKEIFARQEDCNGKLFVCYYTKHGGNGGSVSNSIKEGQVCRDVGTTRAFKSGELDKYDIK